MKSVLISINPKWCGRIASGEKTIEVRKTRPNIDPPFKCYIYCTNGRPYLNRRNGICYLEERDILGGRGYGEYDRLNRTVIGEFSCVGIYFIEILENRFVDILDCKLSCLTVKEMIDYSNGNQLYGWHISDLKIYDKPKELSEFGLKRPPQSWCYVKE